MSLRRLPTFGQIKSLRIAEDLANRHYEGQLDPKEFAEYEALVNGTNMIALLQAKARSFLKSRAAE